MNTDADLRSRPHLGADFAEQKSVPGAEAGRRYTQIAADCAEQKPVPISVDLRPKS
jgi:hypothetical protein